MHLPHTSLLKRIIAVTAVVGGLVLLAQLVPQPFTTTAARIVPPPQGIPYPVPADFAGATPQPIATSSLVDPQFQNPLWMLTPVAAGKSPDEAAKLAYLRTFLTSRGSNPTRLTDQINLANLDRVTLGPGLRMYGFPRDPKAFVPDKRLLGDYLTASNRYLYPIAVDGRGVMIMYVTEQGGSWSTTGTGGGEGTANYYAVAQYLGERITSAKYVEIPGTGIHFVVFEEHGKEYILSLAALGEQMSKFVSVDPDNLAATVRYTPDEYLPPLIAVVENSAANDAAADAMWPQVLETATAAARIP